MTMFETDERAQNLRNEILLRHISSVMTDSERAVLFGLQATNRMRENSKIISPENLKCGHHNWIGEGAVLDASGGLEIGNYVCVGLYSLIWTHTSYLQNKYEEVCISSEHIIRKPTKIGDRVFIGGHSVVYHGITIGDDAIIMPMSVVHEDVPTGATVSGAPIGKFKKLESRVKELEKQYADLYKMYLRQQDKPY